MKIGFSFGKCLGDILAGVVKYEDVLVLVVATKMPDVRSVLEVASSYHFYELGAYEYQDVMDLAKKLYDDGKLHQPRLFGVDFTQPPSSAIWADIFPAIRNPGPELQEAWDMYRVQLTLTNGEELASVAEIQKGHFDAK